MASFEYVGIKIDIYAKGEPTQMQYGYRHMAIEDRMLRLAGNDFRNKIISLKKRRV